MTAAVPQVPPVGAEIIPIPPVETPLHIEAIGGMILGDGEHGITFTMTPEAAIMTCETLQETALRALGQQKFKEWQLDREVP